MNSYLQNFIRAISTIIATFCFLLIAPTDFTSSIKGKLIKKVVAIEAIEKGAKEAISLCLAA